MNIFKSSALKEGSVLGIWFCSHVLSPAVERYVDLNSINPIAPYLTPGTAATRIQDAMNVCAAGDTVRIAAGDYYQQVVVTNKNNVTLAGQPGTTIHAFEAPRMKETLSSHGWNWYPVVAVYRSQNVVLSGLTIDGGQLALPYAWNDDSTRQTRLLGIYFLGSGGDVTNCTVMNFRAPDAQTTDANGLHALNPQSLGDPVTLRVLGSRFQNNQLPILLRGDPGSNPANLRITTTVKDNAISGIGPAPVWSAGIWVVCGVAGELIGNALSDFIGTGSFTSAGIAAYDAGASGQRWRYVPLQPLVIAGNSFSNNGQHMHLIGANGAQVINNSFLSTPLDTGKWGAALVSGTNLLVAANNFADTARAVFVVGNTNFGGWPPMPPTANSALLDNWFCGVSDQIHTNSGATGIITEGTRECETGSLNPVFRSIIALGTNGTALTLHVWTGQATVIEAATNLVDWVPLFTTQTHLPLLEYTDPNPQTKPQRFYRAKTQ